MSSSVAAASGAGGGGGGGGGGGSGAVYEGASKSGRRATQSTSPEVAMAAGLAIP